MNEKECRTCHETKPISEYYTHPKMADGHLNKCKSCVRVRVTKHRDNNLERIRAYDCARAKQAADRERRKEYGKRYKAKYPDKAHARQMLGNAVRDKKVFRKPCAVCGKLRVHGHHFDYSKPLDVIWLCAEHHSQIHHRKYASPLAG